MDFEELSHEELEVLKKYLEYAIGFIKVSNKSFEALMTQDFKAGAEATLSTFIGDLNLINEALEEAES